MSNIKIFYRIISLIFIAFLTPQIIFAECLKGNCVNGYGVEKKLFTEIAEDAYSIYSGTFKDGIPHGKGKLISPYGDIYIGEFKDGMPDGPGTLESSDGNVYIGEFQNGLPHGKGKMKWWDGRTADVIMKYGVIVRIED